MGLKKKRRNFACSLYDHAQSVLCLGVEKKNFKEIKHVCYMTYMAIALNKNPCLGGYEIYNFG